MGLPQTAPSQPAALLVLQEPVQGLRLFQPQWEQGKEDSNVRLKLERVLLVKFRMRSVPVSAAASIMSVLKGLEKTRGTAGRDMVPQQPLVLCVIRLEVTVLTHSTQRPWLRCGNAAVSEIFSVLRNRVVNYKTFCICSGL